MKRRGLVLLLVCLALGGSVRADCDFAAAGALTGVPTGLSHSLGASDTIVDGGSLVFTCDAANHFYLEPDAGGNGEFAVGCSGTAFVQPSWGVTCEIKCTVPGAEATYAESADVGNLKDVDDTVVFTCAEPNGYVTGTSSDQVHTVACLNTGLFETGWPACVNQCSVPNAQSGYDQYDQTNLIAVGSPIEFQCSHAQAYSGSPPNQVQSLTCNSDGNFDDILWPDCDVMCQAPAPESGYVDSHVHESNYYAVDDVITYACDTAGMLVGDTKSNEHSLTCLDTGFFPTDPWPTCALKCLVPDPENGYQAQASDTPVAPGTDLTYTCSDPVATVGDAMAPNHVITCDGTPPSFPTGWPTCEVRCARRDNPKTGYADLAPEIGVTMAGDTVTFSCADQHHTVGTTLSPDLVLTCGNDGTFPVNNDWPDCAVKCELPTPGVGFNLQPANTPPMDEGATLTYTCFTAGQTVGNTLSNQHVVTCESDATTTPVEWPTCAVKCAVPTPEIGYSAPADTTPVGVNEEVTFTCTDPGAKVGDTHYNTHTISCKSDGTFDSGWPTCSVRCIPPVGGPGYNSQPAGTGTVAQGDTLDYTCMEEGHLSGNTDTNINTLTCGSDGSFPDNWPECKTRCLVPITPNGYDDQVSPPGSVDVGASLTYTCSAADAEVGDTLSNTYDVTCRSDGTFPNPTSWPSCAIPPNCPPAPDPDSANTNLVADAGNDDPVKAHRTISYHCTDTAQVTDEGKTIQLRCRADGTYEIRTDWPVCRAAVPCGESPPTPPTESNLANSASTVALEGDEAIYECTDTTWTINGVAGASFSVPCGNGGQFSTSIEWPECKDPNAVFNPDEPECHCLGDIPQDKAKYLRDNFCRNPAIKGNVMIHNGATPTSRKRCGTYDLDDPQEHDHCFCDSPVQQSKTSFQFSLVLNRPMPWEWTVEEDGISYLTKPESDGFADFRARVEQSLDDLINDSDLGDDGYVRSAVQRFKKGEIVPQNEFPATKPDVIDWNTGTNSGGAITCAESLLSGYTLPNRLERTGTGDVDAGAKAVFECTASDDVLMTEVGANGRFVDGQKVELTCAADGSAFTGEPTPGWPVCVSATGTCAIPTPEAGKGYSDQAAGTAAPAAGGQLTYTCADSGHEVTGDPGSNAYVITCSASSSNTDPYYTLDFAVQPADWPACATPSKRKKRAVTVYNYIVVDLETQFLNPGDPTAAQLQTVLDNAATANSGAIGTIFVDPNCNPNICGIRDELEVCSNEFFENLPEGYAALTPFGYYLSPQDPALVDAGNLIQVSEIAELRCTSTDPVQLPRRDDQDHDPDDGKLTIYCIPPDTPGDPGTWSLSSVPPCAAICEEYLPRASADSDLDLVSVLPFDNPSEKLDYLLFNESDRHLFAGDRLNYSCGTKFWSINGGVDTYHDQFMCTDLGVLNTPDESNGETWPTCQPQTEMVVLAVQLMLEKYDRRISDRYKLIDFRELDNQRETTHLDDYFYTISIPVVCCLLMFVCLCCFCSRDGSPCCKLCAAKV